MFAVEAFAKIDTKEASEAGREMVIRGFDGKPIPNALKGDMALTLAGYDSAVYRVAQRVMNADRMKQAQDDEENGYKPDQAMQAQRSEAHSLKALAACVIGWRGILDSKRKELPFDASGAAQLLREYPVIRDQVDAFISNRINFTKASSGA